jgi:hypothetical protein
MAHFAKIGLNNKVMFVTPLEDKLLKDSNNNELEVIGQQYLEFHNNWPAAMWIKTSYNTLHNTHKEGGTPFRGNYAGVGFTWDEDNEIFWPKKPYSSWVKHIASASWKSPIGDAPALTAEQESQNTALTHYWIYDWSEDNQAWELANKKA